MSSVKSVLFGSLLCLIGVAFSGCLEAESATPSSEAEASAIDLNEGLRIEAKNCVQGGGNSVYAMEDGKTKVGPFLAADQNPEVGNPVIGAFGRPVTGPSNGIWHVATKCATYVYMGKEYRDFGMGWIAQMIKRPDFDMWGQPRIQFFVADLSFNNLDFVKVSKDATGGAEISPSTQTTIEMFPLNKYMHVVISEQNHGTFDFTAELHKEYGRKQTEHIRFWMLVATDGSHHHGDAEAAGKTMYRPVSIDIYDEATRGGPKLAGESIGTFTHLPDGHVGNPLGHYQSGFNRVIEIGPAPEGVLYNVTWLH